MSVRLVRILAAALVVALSACRGVPRPTVPAAPRAEAITRLQHDLDAILAEPALERASWGILVRSLTADDTLYARNARKLMMPASALKVVTLAAAAERLGWSYSFETRIVADGAVRQGTLQGNLVIVGGGDPSLDRPVLESWADRLKALGLVKVTGAVVADARAFSGEGLGFGWSWDDVPYAYAAPIAAAQFHENAVDLTLRAGPSIGSPATFQLTPSGSGLSVDNRVKTGPPTARLEFLARRAPHSSSVIAEGLVPEGGQPIIRALSVDDPPQFLATAFTDALLKRNVEVAAAATPSTSPIELHDYSAMTPLITHRSAPLSTLARRLMEVSQNQYAETLVKTMGARAGTPTFEGGLKAVESVLASWGIAADGAVLRDGSGLSRYDFIAPEALAQVLAHMYRDPALSASFFSALNVAGLNGTIAARLKNTPAEGRVRAKDGSMTGVRSLAGIVTTVDGEPLVFTILVNNFADTGPTITAAIDAIVARAASFSRRSRHD